MVGSVFEFGREGESGEGRMIIEIYIKTAEAVLHCAVCCLLCAADEAKAEQKGMKVTTLRMLL